MFTPKRLPGLLIEGKRVSELGGDVTAGGKHYIGLLEEVLDLFKKVPYDPNRFNKRGYLCDTWKSKVCPGPFYFAPQRDMYKNVVFVSNHCITPEMRLTAMNEWVAFVAASSLNDIQWRIDELNDEIFQAVDRPKTQRIPKR